MCKERPRLILHSKNLPKSGNIYPTTNSRYKSRKAESILTLMGAFLVWRGLVKGAQKSWTCLAFESMMIFQKLNVLKNIMNKSWFQIKTTTCFVWITYLLPTSSLLSEWLGKPWQLVIFSWLSQTREVVLSWVRKTSRSHWFIASNFSKRTGNCILKESQFSLWKLLQVA